MVGSKVSGKNTEDVKFGFDLSDNTFYFDFRHPYDFSMVIEPVDNKNILYHENGVVHKSVPQMRLIVSNYFHEHKLMGLRAEDKFKKVLDNRKIPYLYVGQKWEGLEKSAGLIDSLQAKRPDFILPLKEGSSIFLDVKSTQHETFSITYFEMSKMQRLQKHFGLSVWFAFVRGNSVSADWVENDDVPFWFISLDEISKAPCYEAPYKPNSLEPNQESFVSQDIFLNMLTEEE